jgi:response regulator RpfG family c-di-GMP phosphodiesterase
MREILENILIVDDDPGLRKTLQDILRLKGYNALPCPNGAEAINNVRNGEYHLALIDLKLEDMPGLEVMQELKQITPEIECIVLTGFASQASAIEAINLGAYSYVQKPYDMENLLVTIRRALERQQSRLALKNRTQEISQLYEAGRQLGATLDLDTIYTLVHKVIDTNMPCDGLAISAYDKETELITCLRMWSERIPVDISTFPPMPLNKNGNSIQSQAILSGESLYLPDYLAQLKKSKNDYFMDKDGLHSKSQILEDRPIAQSALLVPIKLENQVLGVIQVFSSQPEVYTQSNLRFLEALAPQVAAATANAHLYKQAQSELKERIKADAEVQRKADEFATLYDTSQILASQQDLPALMSAIVEHAARLLQAPSAYIYLYDPLQQDLVLKHEIGIPHRKGSRLSLNQGMAGWVMREQKPLIIDDYSHWPHRVPRFVKDGFTSIVNVPIRSAGELIGVLGVQDGKREGNNFTQEDSRLLTLFAAQAASAIHNTRLMDETKHQAGQMGLLYDAGLALNSILEPRAQLEFLFKIALDTLEADRASFFRYFPKQDYLKFDLGIGYSQTALEELYKITRQATESQSLTGWVAVNRIPLNISDLDSDPRYLPIDPQLKSGLFAAVEREKQLLGVLAVFSTRSKAFDSSDERMLQLFANQAAVAMENTRLLSETQRRLERIQALHDIDLSINSSVNLNVTLKILLEQVLNRLQVDAADILLYNPHSLELEYTTGLGLQDYPLSRRNIRLGEGFAGQVVVERKLVSIPDLEKAVEITERERLFNDEGFTSYYAIPLVSKGEFRGVMEILQRTSFTRDDEWIGFLSTLGNQATIAIDNASLFDNLQRSNMELSLAYETTLEGWAKALEMRDVETEGHSQRVTELTLRIGREMGIAESTLIHVRRGALLHDIGKMGIPDSILLKPAALTEDEWQIMKMHPVFAYKLLYPIAYLRQAIDIPYCHHEKWDGSGYPRGLRGIQIPLEARIFAVIDVWDALLSDRPYRKAWQQEQALEHIREQSGKHFDPQVVEAFLKMLDHD